MTHLDLLLLDPSRQPLEQSNADALFGVLRLRMDDGDGLFEASDATIATVTAPTLTDGAFEIDLDDAADPAPDLDMTARELAAAVRSLRRRLDGDEVAATRQEPSLPGILERVGYAVDTQSSSTSAPTATSRRAVALASEELTAVLAELREIAEQRLPELEASLESAGAPWTPGRLPSWPPAAH